MFGTQSDREGSLLENVIGRISSIYEYLLSLEHHAQIHLIPLRASPEGIQCRFILLDLRAGYSPQEVAGVHGERTMSQQGARLSVFEFFKSLRTAEKSRARRLFIAPRELLPWFT